MLASAAGAERPNLQVVTDDYSEAREARIRMIQHIRHGYAISLGYFVDRAILRHGSLSNMPDSELETLHGILQDAVECIQWDIPYEASLNSYKLD